jgi:hypothetical protein
VQQYTCHTSPYSGDNGKRCMRRIKIRECVVNFQVAKLPPFSGQDSVKRVECLIWCTWMHQEGSQWINHSLACWEDNLYKLQ